MFAADSGRHVDPDTIKDREQFKEAMQALRTQAGLSYRDAAKLAK